MVKDLLEDALSKDAVFASGLSDGVEEVVDREECVEVGSLQAFLEVGLEFLTLESEFLRAKVEFFTSDTSHFSFVFGASTLLLEPHTFPLLADVEKTEAGGELGFDVAESGSGLFGDGCPPGGGTGAKTPFLGGGLLAGFSTPDVELLSGESEEAGDVVEGFFSLPFVEGQLSSPESEKVRFDTESSKATRELVLELTLSEFVGETELGDFLLAAAAKFGGFGSAEPGCETGKAGEEIKGLLGGRRGLGGGTTEEALSLGEAGEGEVEGLFGLLGLLWGEATPSLRAASACESFEPLLDLRRESGGGRCDGLGSGDGDLRRRSLVDDGVAEGATELLTKAGTWLTGCGDLSGRGGGVADRKRATRGATKAAAKTATEVGETLEETAKSSVGTVIGKGADLCGSSPDHETTTATKSRTTALREVFTDAVADALEGCSQSHVIRPP